MNLVDKYNSIKKNTKYKSFDTTYHPAPTDEDYAIGYIDRFFIRLANQETGIINEVDSKIFVRLQTNPLYIRTQIRWKITGPTSTIFNEDGSVKEFGIAHANKRSVELGKKDIPNLDKFLIDYTKFSKV